MHADISSDTARSENTSSTVAVINTEDPNIKIILSLEVWILPSLIFS
jgi:hypothetical protein